MSAYSTGSVNVTVGSTSVVGNSTSFTTYVTAGNLFKLVGTDTFYTVAGVSTATRLILSSRYTDTSNQTATYENIASAVNATKLYSGTLSNIPIILNSLKITASEVFTESGTGVLTGSGGSAGTINYDTGAWTITLATTVNATYNTVASHYYGEALTSMPYQVVKDFTSVHTFPEMGRNDTDFATIYTRMVRSLDTKLNVMTGSSLTATTGTIRTLYSTTGHVTTLTASNLTASSGTINSFTSPSGTISAFSSTTGHILTCTASNLTATTGTIKTLSSTTGHITTLTSNSLTATTITGNTSITSPKLIASSYLKIGSKYIFSASVTEVSASVVAEASSLVTTASLKGSLFMNTSNLWYFTATNTAATATW